MAGLDDGDRFILCWFLAIALYGALLVTVGPETITWPMVYLSTGYVVGCLIVAFVGSYAIDRAEA